MIDLQGSERLEAITPRATAASGCQNFLRVHGAARDLLAAPESGGIVWDIREPDILRPSLMPLHNGFDDVWQFARILGRRGP